MFPREHHRKEQKMTQQAANLLPVLRKKLFLRGGGERARMIK